MWILLIVFAVLMYMLSTKRQGYVSDEATIMNIVAGIRAKRPELVPLETVSIDNGVARMLYLNMNDYSGQVIDSTLAGPIPRSPPDASLTPFIENKYKSYDEIQNFRG